MDINALYPPSSFYYRRKQIPIGAVFCKGDPDFQDSSWPEAPYRAEVARHVLENRFDDLLQCERETCERELNGRPNDFDQHRMKRLVNTYGHEL